MLTEIYPKLMFLSSVCSFTKNKEAKPKPKKNQTQRKKTHPNKLKPPNSFDWLQICSKTMRDKYHQPSISKMVLIFSTHKSKPNPKI